MYVIRIGPPSADSVRIANAFYGAVVSLLNRAQRTYRNRVRALPGDR